jgi:hypothetical protein
VGHGKDLGQVYDEVMELKCFRREERQRKLLLETGNIVNGAVNGGVNSDVACGSTVAADALYGGVDVPYGGVNVSALGNIVPSFAGDPADLSPSMDVI